MDTPPDRIQAGTGHEHAPGLATFTHRGVDAMRGPESGAGSRFAIVVARFNAAITSQLFAGAVDVLLDAGTAPNHIAAVQVPGAVEIALAARELAHTNHYHGIIALGCVIRGDTSHFDYVCGAATDGCLRVQLDFGVPVGFGLITCDTAEQARERAAGPGEPGHNVGADAARAALEMAGLARIVRGG